MKKIKYIIIPLLLIAGCTWQKIPADPEYAKQPTLPLRVGVVATYEPSSMLYVPGVISELKAMRLFTTIIYPYLDDGTVDVLATISVDGDWKPSGAGPQIAAALSLGLASAFVGPSVTGTHVIKAAMVSGNEDIGFYSAKISTSSEWGVMADSDSVSKKTNALQTKRLADALAKAIREDQTNLLAKVKINNKDNPVSDAYVARKAPRVPAESSQPSAPPRPAVLAQNPMALKQGLFSFEAEKIAMGKGCTTSNGIRPVAYLVKESYSMESYTIACKQGSMAVRCVNKVCGFDQ